MKTLKILRHLRVKVTGDMSLLKERTYFLRMRRQEFIFPRKKLSCLLVLAFSLETIIYNIISRVHNLTVPSSTVMLFSI